MTTLVDEVIHRQRFPPKEVARAIRVGAGVSQERLAIELGVARVTVARWELGLRKPRGAVADRYRDLLERLRVATGGVE